MTFGGLKYAQISGYADEAKFLGCEDVNGWLILVYD
jgi:hypothetical protein